MIKVQHVTKKFAETLAVHNVSFEVNEGETLVLLGTSGSGKTTMLRMINRLIEASSGEIFINGGNTKLNPPALLRRSVGYVLQGYGLFPHYTVAENIAVVPRLLKWPKEKIEQRITGLLNKLRLPPELYMHVYPDVLSGGQKQRVGLARALAADPPILLMDEPFGALDPLTRADIRKEFKELDELKKKTIILVTHDVQEAFELGDKICLMDKGAVVQTGKPEDLLFRPVNDFVKTFFNQQGLLLALQSVSLKNIWNDLPEADENGSYFLQSHQSLWEAMELLTEKDKPVVVVDKPTGAIKAVDFTHLQSAFIKRKRQC